MAEKVLGCQVSTIPHERRFINSIRHQSMAQLFVSGVDKSSCCFAKMATKCIFLTSVFVLLEAGPTVYWHLRNSESVGAGPHVECLPKKIDRQQDAIASSSRSSSNGVSDGTSSVAHSTP